MRLHVYTICWNERLMLPYFFRHYRQWAERIVVYDNGSDDGSCELVAAESIAELRFFETNNESREDLEIEVKNQAWKESRGKADWVVVCDVDELVHHPDVPGCLADCHQRGVTLPQLHGYQMLSDQFPTTNGQIYDEVKSGFREPIEDKQVLFDPNLIDEIGSAPGCHSLQPNGKCVAEHVPGLKLLHFKFLGWDYLRARYRQLGARKSQYDRERGFGHHYFLSDEDLAAQWKRDQQRAEPVIGV